MLLEGELAFEGVDDRLDPLADPAEFAEPWFLALAVGAQKIAPSSAISASKSRAGEALVRDDGVPLQL